MLLFVNMLFGYAQKGEAIVELDVHNLKIGEQAQLKLSFTYPVESGKYQKIFWPVILDTLSEKVEVLSQSAIDTIYVDSIRPYRFELVKHITITSFEEGAYNIGPFEFYINADSQEVISNVEQLNVSSIEVDTTQNIKDIKPIMQVNYTWIDWIIDHKTEIAVFGIVLILIVLLFYLFNKYYKRKEEVVVVPEVIIPPHELAFKRLDELSSKKLWQNGKEKEYHTELTEILREYLENRYSIKALEQTTDEILYGIRNIGLSEALKEQLRKALLLSDLVKFAKERPLASEHEASYAGIREFIENTKQVQNELTNSNETDQ